MPGTEEQQLVDEVRTLHADATAWSEGLHLEFKLSESKVPTDAATGQDGLTLEGLLMFGTEEAIIRHMPQLQLNYFEYDTTETADFLPVITGASSGDKGKKAPVITGASSGDKGGKAPVITGASSGDKGGLPLILSDEVQQKIAALRPCQRLSPELLDELVLQICKGNWVTLPQLAHLLDRTPDYLRRRCLQSLVRHGLLQMKDPQKPTHPKQAYTSVPSACKTTDE